MRKSLAVVGQAEKPTERKDARENRERILAAVHALLKTKPMSEICMDAVAEAAGVGKGTLYRHFKDRSSLCMTLLDDASRRLQNETIAGLGLPKDTPPAARLCTFVDRLIRFHLDNAALLEEANSFARDRFAHPARTWMHFELHRLLQASGTADASLQADWILSLLDPGLFLWQLSRGQTVDDVVRSVKAFITRGANAGQSQH